MKFVALPTCVVDFYPQLNKSFLGGNSLNLASMWRTLDQNAEVSVIAGLGKDEYAIRIINFLEKSGINSKHVYLFEGKTANNQLRIDESGERYGIEGAWDGGVYEKFLLNDKDWNYVNKHDVIATTGHNPNFEELIHRKNSNQLLVVDYLDVENEIPIEETIQYTDIALLTAKKEMLTYYKELADDTGKLLIITLGAEGSYVFFNHKEFFQQALPVDKVVDTTGCGDAYLAGFSYAYANGKSISEAMKVGAEAAKEILRYFGGVGKADKK